MSTSVRIFALFLITVYFVVIFSLLRKKKFALKRVIFSLILLVLVIIALILIIKNPNGIKGVWDNIKTLGSKFTLK